MTPDTITISDFIVGQLSNTNSTLALHLAYQIKQAIIKYKENNGENEHGFSIDAEYENGEFIVHVDFFENNNMTIMYHEESNNNIVKSLFELTNDDELCRVAGLMISEDWVDGLCN